MIIRSFAFSPSLGPLRALLFLEKKRDVWEQGRFRLELIYFNCFVKRVSGTSGKYVTFKPHRQALRAHIFFIPSFAIKKNLIRHASISEPEGIL